LALFEGSNRADFLDAIPLYLIPETGERGVMHYADVHVSRGFRYVRYVGPNSAHCNIAELEFWGYEGEGDDTQFYQITNLPTLSIHVYDGTNPVDKENELESNITITYDNGLRIQEYPVLTRCRGNATMRADKKPYRVKFNDGKSHHMLKDSPLESPAKAKKWTLISNYGDKTLIRNTLSYEISRRMGMPYTVYNQPVDLIMNGEYKGYYLLCDQITVDPNRVDITEMETWDNEEPALTGGYLVEVDAYASRETSWFNSKRGIPVTIKSPDEDDITAEQKSYITNYFNLFESAVWRTNYTDEEEGYRKYLDVESFLRHFLIGELTGNTDTYWSTYMYKDREQQQFFVGPCWDFDLTFDNDSRTYPVSNRNDWLFRSGGSIAGNMKSTVTRILSDPYADQRMKEIWSEVRKNGTITTNALFAFMDSIVQDISASRKLNFIRWPILKEVEGQDPYEAVLKVVRDYIPERIEWIDDYLAGAFPSVADGTFYIKTPQDLLDFARTVRRGGNGSNAYLTTDLDMNDYSEYFSPIGTEKNPFCGIFDGQGHVISNLHITGVDYTGLFGVVSGGATITDLTLDSSCSICGESYLGVVGGSNGSGKVTIARVGNETNVTGTGKNVAGIFGCNMNAAAQVFITDCYNTGQIVGEQESGALCGWTGKKDVVSNCYNIGTVSGTSDAVSYVVRGNATLTNVYTTCGSQGTIIRNSVVRTGELCYMLNANHGMEEPYLWRQTLGEDPYPVLLQDHKKVYHLNNTYQNQNDYMNPGDVNSDGAVDEADLLAIKDYIMGHCGDRFIFEMGDLNGDKEINAMDLVQMIKRVNHTTTIDGEGISVHPNALSINNFRLSAGGGKNVLTWGSMSQSVTAFQTDLVFSDGLTPEQTSFVKGDLLSDSHVIEVAQKGDTIRVLGYATDNAPLQDFSGDFFSFDLTAAETFKGGSIQMTNQLMITLRNTILSLEDVTCHVTWDPTVVNEIVMEHSEGLEGAEIFSLTGLRVTKPRNGGIYIVNGKKKLIR